MTQVLRRKHAKPVDGERRPITAHDCRRNVLFYFLGTTFIFATAFLTHSGWLERFSNSIMALIFLAPFFQWLGILRRIRRGERFDTVYTAPKPEEAQVQAQRVRTGAVVMIAIMSALFVPLMVMGAEFPKVVLVFVALHLLSCGIGIAMYFSANSISRKLKSKIEPVSSATARTTQLATSSQDSTSANTQTAAAGRAGHWWTDTQAREDAKVTSRR